MPSEEYLELNGTWWDERAAAHAASPDYGIRRLLADPTALSEVVAFDRLRLGDLIGVDAVHMQCHIGTDTLSLARLGADVTGLDLSEASLEQARHLAAAAGAEIDYVQSPVYDAVSALGAERFDLVYTGVGALCWLPSIRRWAEVVAGLLRPGGRLFLRDGHPVLWSLADPGPDGALKIEHAYFEREEPTIWDDEGTYVATEVEFRNNKTHEWNHGIGQIVTALMDSGMELTALEEHDSVPWNALPGLMEELPDLHNEWRLTDRPWRLPHTYTIQARKRP